MYYMYNNILCVLSMVYCCAPFLCALFVGMYVICALFVEMYVRVCGVFATDDVYLLCIFMYVCTYVYRTTWCVFGLCGIDYDY